MRRVQMTLWCFSLVAASAWLLSACGGGSKYDPGETTAAACQDGADNDGDGQSDCDDSDCAGFVFCQPERENTAGRCQDGTDNDGDGNTDCADTECMGFSNCQPQTEDTATDCQDGQDNDSDGDTDCDDTDCMGFVFCAGGGEADAVACQDGLDNDEDGATDCDDADCAGFTFCAPGQENTSTACADLQDNDGDGRVDCADTDCAGFTFCAPVKEESATLCQDGLDNDFDTMTDCADPGCQGFVFCFSTDETLAITCQDGQDNDADGATDCDDPDCAGYTFCADGENSSAACQDALDNDADTLTDCADPDCQGFVFCLEVEISAAACQDLLDNDNDTLIDCDDPDCDGYVFCLSDENTSGACQDGLDNDGDGGLDCLDSDCAGFTFCQSYEDTADACRDGQDNDADGAADCVDPDCQGFVFCLSLETTAAACQDGLDNDSDTLIDCDDSGCQGYIFCYATGEETSTSACQDGLDNDGDQAVDCADADCWPWGFCQHYQGFPVVDAWGETWDGLERPPLPWAEASQVCESLGGRLPTVTELWRNNASSGTADLAGNTAANYLWTRIRNYRVGYRNNIRLSDGSISYATEATALYFRCVWPDRAGVGFDADRCHGDPGAPCLAFDRVWNVDTQDRPALDYVAATDECQFYGASIPTPADFGRMIHAGLPNGRDTWTWAAQAKYWYNLGYGYTVIKWLDSQQTYWQYGTGFGSYAAGSSSYSFRCVGLADPAAFDVPAPACNSACQQFSNRRSTLVADDTNRGPAAMRDAVDACAAEGAALPNAGEATELIREGWANGAGVGVWNWVSDTVYYYNASLYAHALVAWAGDDNPHYYYTSAGNWGALTDATNAAMYYRCVWHQDGLALPGCQADEVVVWDSNAFACAAGADGSSAGNANVVEMNDDFGNAWDGVQRASAAYADAAAACEALGGRLPSASEIFGARFLGNPHTYIGDENNVSYLWTTTPTGTANARALVRVSDGLSSAAVETASANYRCVWPALHGDVLAANNCYGPPGDACYEGVDGLVADKYDRVALDMAGAINECAMAGGYLADHGQVMRLIHAGWPNGSGQWQWMNNAMYWYNGGLGYALFNWSGDGDPDWFYQGGVLGSLSAPTIFRQFRCAYSTDLP